MKGKNRMESSELQFGKYKGEPIKDIPADYKRWALDNIEWHNGNMNIKQAFML